jgi:hypothetical protein
MTQRDLFINKQGMHYRSVEVWIERGICDKCECDCSCMAFDNSDAEYSTGYLCSTCIEVMFDRSIDGIKLCLPLEEPSI